MLSSVIKISEATGAEGALPRAPPSLPFPNEPGDAGRTAAADAAANGQLAERAVLHWLGPASGP